MSGGILIAGIGNVFLGDDGFGVEVVRRLAERRLPQDVDVVDYGIRGMDLVYALLEERDAVIFVDTASRGESPGTLSLIEPEIAEGEVTIDAHGMDPVKVLGLARALGAPPTRTYVVACEPAFILDGEDGPDVVVALTEPVEAAVNGAMEMVESLIARLQAAEEASSPHPRPLSQSGRGVRESMLFRNLHPRSTAAPPPLPVWERGSGGEGTTGGSPSHALYADFNARYKTH